MKHSFLFTTLLAILFSGFANANEIDLTKDPTSPPIPRILASFQSYGIFNLPVSATIDETELAVYFESSVGIATITVYDEWNNVIVIEELDTDSTLSISIPSSEWITGNYSINISYGTTYLTGYFVME